MVFNVCPAAHCFYNEDYSRFNDPSEYTVVVGKLTRDYNKEDSEVTKYHKVRKYSLNRLL